MDSQYLSTAYIFNAFNCFWTLVYALSSTYRSIGKLTIIQYKQYQNKVRLLNIIQHTYIRQPKHLIIFNSNTNTSVGLSDEHIHMQLIEIQFEFCCILAYESHDVFVFIISLYFLLYKLVGISYLYIMKKIEEKNNTSNDCIVSVVWSPQIHAHDEKPRRNRSIGKIVLQSISSLFSLHTTHTRRFFSHTTNEWKIKLFCWKVIHSHVPVLNNLYTSY